MNLTTRWTLGTSVREVSIDQGKRWSIELVEERGWGHWETGRRFMRNTMWQQWEKEVDGREAGHQGAHLGNEWGLGAATEESKDVSRPSHHRKREVTVQPQWLRAHAGPAAVPEPLGSGNWPALVSFAIQPQCCKGRERRKPHPWHLSQFSSLYSSHQPLPPQMLVTLPIPITVLKSEREMWAHLWRLHIRFPSGACFY